MQSYFISNATLIKRLFLEKLVIVNCFAGVVSVFLLSTLAKADTITITAGPTLQLIENGGSGKLVFDVEDSTVGSTLAIKFNSPSGRFLAGAGPDLEDKPTLTDQSLTGDNIKKVDGVTYAILKGVGTSTAVATYTFTAPNDKPEGYKYDDFLGSWRPLFVPYNVDTITGLPLPGSPATSVQFAYAYPGLPNGTGAVGVTDIPELSTWTMLISGFAGIGFLGYRRARAGAFVA